MEYRIDTKIFKNGVIEQAELHTDLLTDKVKLFAMQICDTKDKAMRKALIELGWTPPKDDFKIANKNSNI